MSPVDFVERSCVSEAAIPHLIHHLLGVSLISAGRPSPDGQNSSSSYAFLMLSRQFPLTSSKELPSPPALSAK